MLPIRNSFLALAAACALGAAGCAGSGAPQRRLTEVARPTVDEPAVDRGPSEYDAEIGGMSQDEVERLFARLRPRLVDCVHQASNRLSAIGGSASLRMRVDRQGKIRWAYLHDSTLGDRDAEKCVLDLVKRRTWPKPLSGEGLAETSFEVEPADLPLDLPAVRGSWFAERARAATRRCRKGIAGDFRATAYLGPDGEVLAAGVAPPDEKGEQASDCIVEALRDLRLGYLVGHKGSTSKISVRIR